MFFKFSFKFYKSKPTETLYPWNALYPHWAQYLSQPLSQRKFMHTKSYFRLDWLGVALWLCLNEDGTIIIFNRFYYFGLDQLTRTENGRESESESESRVCVCSRRMGWQYSNRIAFICVLSLNWQLKSNTNTEHPNWGYLRTTNSAGRLFFGIGNMGTGYAQVTANEIMIHL